MTVLNCLPDELPGEKQRSPDRQGGTGKGWEPEGRVLGKELSRQEAGEPLTTFVQDRIGWFVSSHRLLGQMLMTLGQTLHLSKAGVEGHGGVRGVLRHVQVSCSAQLLLDHQGLLQKLTRETGIRQTFIHLTSFHCPAWPNCEGRWFGAPTRQCLGDTRPYVVVLRLCGPGEGVYSTHKVSPTTLSAFAFYI